LTDDPVLSDEELNNRIKGVIKPKPEDEKRAKGIKEQVSLDPKIYDLYSYFKNEEGYTGSFNQFLTDFILDSAKEKGYDIQVVKSARMGRFVRGNSNIKEDKEMDDYESALSILGMGSSNPKEQALRIAIEAKQQEIEQKRLQNMQLQIQIENQRLELERKKIENEKLRKELSLPPQVTQQEATATQSEIYKMMMDYNQKMFEILAKAKDSGMGDNFMKYLLEQNQQTNNMIVGLLTQQNDKKLQELENLIYSTSSDQQFEKFKRQYELFKELGALGGGMTPEQMQKEYELKLKQLEMEREDRKQERDERRAEHLTEVIRDAFTQFSQTIGEPIGKLLAEQTKQKLNNMVPQQKPPEQVVTPPVPPPTPPVQEQPPEPVEPGQQAENIKTD